MSNGVLPIQAWLCQETNILGMHVFRIMKRKFKQWWSSIPPMSTKNTTIFPHLNWTHWTQKRPQQLTLWKCRSFNILKKNDVDSWETCFNQILSSICTTGWKRLLFCTKRSGLLCNGHRDWSYMCFTGLVSEDYVLRLSVITLSVKNQEGNRIGRTCMVKPV